MTLFIQRTHHCPKYSGLWLTQSAVPGFLYLLQLSEQLSTPPSRRPPVQRTQYTLRAPSLPRTAPVPIFLPNPNTLQSTKWLPN